MVVRTLALLFVVFNLAACTPTYLPCRNEIHKIRYTPDWICVEKATAGQKMLTDNGVENRLCCGCYFDRGHCWNETRKDGLWFMCDMSRGKPPQGWPVEQYPEYVREDIWYEPIGLRELISELGVRRAMRAIEKNKIWSQNHASQE